MTALDAVAGSVLAGVVVVGGQGLDLGDGEVDGAGGGDGRQGAATPITTGVGGRVGDLDRERCGAAQVGRAAVEGGACPVFCVSVLQVGVESVGVGGGELGQGLVPVGGDLSFDELALALHLEGGSPFSLSRSRARLSTGVTDRQPQQLDHRLIERGSGRGSSVILAQLVDRSLDRVGGGGTSHEVGER